MELHCNLLECRKPLSQAAVVTTCSHIFCPDCAHASFPTSNGGTAAGGAVVRCPACESALPNPDDIVLNELEPSEDYKSSVMAGLKPDIIMDIAGRALNFWVGSSTWASLIAEPDAHDGPDAPAKRPPPHMETQVYQTTQEGHYNDMMLKATQEKCADLERSVTALRREAEEEVGALTDKLQRVQLGVQEERRRTQELTEQLGDKNRQFLKLQQMYDKLKRKTVLLPTQPQPAQQPILHSGARSSSIGTFGTSPFPASGYGEDPRQHQQYARGGRGGSSSEHGAFPFRKSASLPVHGMPPPGPAMYHMGRGPGPHRTPSTHGNPAHAPFKPGASLSHAAGGRVSTPTGATSPRPHHYRSTSRYLGGGLLDAASLSPVSTPPPPGPGSQRSHRGGVHAGGYPMHQGSGSRSSYRP